MSETPDATGGKDESEPNAETPEPTVQPPETPEASETTSIPSALGSPSAVDSPPEMTMGAVLNRAFALYKQFFGRFFLLALVVFLVLNLATALAAVTLRNNSGGGAFLSLVAIIVTIIGESLLLGALVFAVQDVLDGRADDSISGLLEKARPYIGRLIGAGILFGLGVAIGLILLVVPGLYLLTIWAVFAPVIVLEGTGITDSFGRSRALVSGRFWPVFGVVIVASVLSAVAQSFVSLVLSFLPTFLRYWLGGAIASAVAVPFLVLAVTLTYFALRDEKAASLP
jgi:hypothetical protein